jgi:hypothetical protein
VKNVVRPCQPGCDAGERKDCYENELIHFHLPLVGPRRNAREYQGRGNADADLGYLRGRKDKKEPIHFHPSLFRAGVDTD